MPNTPRMRAPPRAPPQQEVGPYVYAKSRRRRGAAFVRGGGAVQYHNYEYHTFVPEMSSGSPEDRVTTLNVPLVGEAQRCVRCPWAGGPGDPGNLPIQRQATVCWMGDLPACQTGMLPPTPSHPAAAHHNPPHTYTHTCTHTHRRAGGDPVQGGLPRGLRAQAAGQPGGGLGRQPRARPLHHPHRGRTAVGLRVSKFGGAAGRRRGAPGRMRCSFPLPMRRALPPQGLSTASRAALHCGPSPSPPAAGARAAEGLAERGCVPARLPAQRPPCHAGCCRDQLLAQLNRWVPKLSIDPRFHLVGNTSSPEEADAGFAIQANTGAPAPGVQAARGGSLPAGPAAGAA